MNKESHSKLAVICNDYSEVVGKPFNYFFCPILFRDDDVLLCKAHIINKTFRNTINKCTIQRKDVDNFFGSLFESDFTLLPFIKKHISTGIFKIAFTNKSLNDKLSPKILLDGNPVEHFAVRNNFPKHFVQFDILENNKKVSLGLKISPKDAVSSRNRHWEFSCNKDMRLSSVVSLIKAAHLTLFDLLGYRYVFSSTSVYVGNHILGEFYRQNYMKKRAEILKSAKLFFNSYANMVRPILSNGLNLQGSISDNIFLVCWFKDDIWAKIVLIKTEGFLHAVLVPVLDQLNTFTEFLENPAESISVSLCQFDKDHWNINDVRKSIIWPKGKENIC